MNLKIAILKINNLRILRLQGFKVRNASFRRILTPALSRREREKRSQPLGVAMTGTCFITHEL